MAGPDYASLVAGQRAYFLAARRARRVADGAAEGDPGDVDESRDAMCEALWQDLRRNETDADLMDVDYSIQGGRLRARRTSTSG